MVKPALQPGYIFVHLAVLLFGLAGLFGKLVPLHSESIVFGRVLFASIALFFLIKLSGLSLRLLKPVDYLFLFAQGSLLALHWYAFFHSIQLSSVATGLLAFSSFPVFVVFLEPLFFNSKIGIRQLLQALIVVAGLFLILPEGGLLYSTYQGVLWGVLSGFTFALHSLFSKRFVQAYNGLIVAFYQDVSATLVLLPFVYLQVSGWAYDSVVLLLLLGVVFTAVSHALFIQGLRAVPAYRASLIAMLEPVYGTLAAALVIHEIPDVRVLAGGSIILGTAIWVTLKK